MTRLRSEGEAVEVLYHPQCGDTGTISGAQSGETPIPNWCAPAPACCTPTGFVWQGTSYCTLVVCNRWRVHTRWWEPDQTLWREYLKVLVAPATETGRLGHNSGLSSPSDGFLCLLYRDLLLGEWFLARVYD
jgi:hypothetical protein